LLSNRRISLSEQNFGFEQPEGAGFNSTLAFGFSFIRPAMRFRTLTNHYLII